MVQIYFIDNKPVLAMKEQILNHLIIGFVHLAIIPSGGNPLLRKCILGDALLNPLVGPSGVQQKDDYAVENVLGWTSGKLDKIESTNLTESQINDCLQEYVKGSANVVAKPLPPGVTPEKDPSQQPYLPPAAGKDVLVSNGHGEYYTTYDESRYNFKEKGYVVDPPNTDASIQPLPTAEPSTTPRPSIPTTTKHPQKDANKKNKNELQLWYKAFVSVVSKYM